MVRSADYYIRYLCYICSIDLKNVLCFGPYMGNCIVFFYFLSFLDLFAMYAQCRACFCGETCFNHEGVLVLLCLNVFLITLLADVFLRIDVE